MPQIIKIGLAGTGLSAKVFHAPFWEADGRFQLQRVYARSAEKGRAAFPDAQVSENFADLLADDIDLIVITTPNQTHYALAEQALLAGKNVLVEKPVCATAEEARHLAALAEKQGVLLTVYQNRRWDHAPLTAKTLLAENLLGDIVDAEIRFERYAAGLNKKAWKETGGAGVGLVYDLGVHLLDMAVDLFGMPEALYADIRHQHQNALSDDYFAIILYYTDGKRVNLVGSKYAREPLPFMALHGKLGSYIQQEADNQEALLAAGAKPVGNWNSEPETHWGLLHTVANNGDIIRRRIAGTRGDYGAFYRQLYDALVHRAPPPVTMEQAISVLTLIEKAYLSAKEGRKIRI
ncbi:MAG: Gfo/Idh/MocA family oxidoreductase [Neisseria sp.]|uniref:Gfo/Idh/MocA family oxidoreductase n=1 Tax=Neisseria sp. TaxID=192066 RepID=UPI0026DC9BEC|nr:Gfo/Idh/MocA family oxidoreductase [Neisseria sp.]MDO4641106.1 Gfo/Idh/MocA family oxidoreductase [Neisseria sp.]